MTEPTWPSVKYPTIDYQDIIYYSAPKQKAKLNSLEEVDPTSWKHLRSWALVRAEAASNVAVDAILIASL